MQLEVTAVIQGTFARRAQSDSWSEQRYLLQFPLFGRIVLEAKICTVRRGEKSPSPQGGPGVISVSGKNADIRDVPVLKTWGSSPGDSLWQTAFPSSWLLLGTTG